MKNYSKLQRSQFAFLLRTTLVVGVVSSLINLVLSGFSSASFLVSGLLGCLYTFVIMGMELFVLSARRLRRLPVALFLLIRIFLYMCIGVTVYLLVGLVLFPEFVFYLEQFLFTVAYVGVVSVVLNIAFFLVSFLGSDFLRAYLFSGRTRGRSQNYIFFFVDLRNSTSLAERIGAKRFFNCLNDFIMLAEQVIKYQRGHIYKYVGDCIIAYWPENPGNFVRAYTTAREIETLIALNRQHFTENYEYDIDYAMSLHSGEAAMGEIGVQRRELGFLSDVLNTAERILGTNKRLQTRLLLSGDFFHKLRQARPAALRGQRFRLYRQVALRGKQSGLDLYNPAT